jgi:hypothetical protein
LAPAFFIPQSLSLRVTNSSSDAILVKRLVQSIETRTKIEPMQPVGFTLAKAALGTERVTTGSHFDVLPSPGSPEGFGMSAKLQEWLEVFNKRFAMVREGK